MSGKGKIIAVAIPKGGVGKTTTAINLSIAFSKSGKKILLIDLDPAGSCASGLGYDKEDINVDIFNVLQFNVSFQQAIINTVIPNLDFLPLKHMNYLDELRLGKLTSNELLLKNILKPEALSYDYVILDCPPYLTGTTNSALIAADSFLIPVMPGQFSIDAVEKIFSHIKTIHRTHNPVLKVEGILLTMYEFNTNVSFAAKKELFRKYPEYILNTSIPKNATVGEASINNKPLLIFEPNARASKAYIKLASELSERKNLFNLAVNS
jgi:chromosome partitioning protein